MLVFVFGYVTCQTFYFIKSTRVSLKLMKSSRVIYLLMMAKAMEKYKIAEEVMVKHLHESGKDEKEKVLKLEPYHGQLRIHPTLLKILLVFKTGIRQ